MKFLNHDGNDFPVWENVRLGDIAKISTGFTPRTDDATLWDGDIPWLSIKGMNDAEKYIYSANKTITHKAIEKKQIIPAGTLVMTFKLTLGRLGILKSDMFTNEAICNFTWKNQKLVDTEFMYYALSTVDVESFGSRAVMGITLNSESLDSIVVPFPSLPEQKKIAEFFSALDERIALTADKVKLLKEQKQGYLQQVFARELVFTDKNGERFPEWEEKRLGEISTVKRGASPRPIADKKWFSDTSDTGWVRISDVSSSKKYLLETPQYLSPAGVERSVKVELGSLILSIAGSVGKPAITKVPVCIHDGFILFKNLTADTEYVYYFLEHSRKGWDKLSQSGSQANLNSEIVGNLDVPLPSLPEQEKIVSFFSALDERIELTENKLELLKEQKKGYLQGIFG